MTTELLHEVGTLALPEVLDERARATIRAQLEADAGESTKPYSPDTMARELDPEFARSRTSWGSPQTRGLVTAAIGLRLAELEDFWRRPLELNPELHFLTYDVGDYIRPHKDVIVPTIDTESPGVELPEKIRERLVVFTLFLNDDFEGGEFALLPGFPRPPLVVQAAPGTMVAFPSDLAHAVRTVTAGRRHSITGWFRAPGQDKTTKEEQ
jgi:predicted 2-oxoglutarate/Fe(II)-dependent dioxygenase YbiX